MDALAGPYLASAALLVAAGATKVLDPLPLRRALMSVGVFTPALLVRVAAAAEVALGMGAVLVGGRIGAAGIALSYALFTAFVLHARSRGGVLASCGCFGRADTPPTLTHAVTTGALALTATAVAVRPLAPLHELLGGSPWSGVPLLVATAAVAVTGYLVLARLPLLRVRT